MTKINNFKINSKYLPLIKIVLIISCPFFTLLLSNRFEPLHILIGCIFSFMFSIFIVCKSKLNPAINLKKMLLYLFIACYFIKRISIYANKNIIMVNKVLKKVFNINLSPALIIKLIGIMSIPIIIFFLKWFFDHIVKKVVAFFDKMTKTEKTFLSVVFIAASIFSICYIYKTTAFSRPIYNKSVIRFDAVYTSDSGMLLKYDTYLNVSHPENDIRQPLFGVFSLPFSLTARFISEFCFFCRPGYQYETIMTIIQYILLAISIILLARLLKIPEERKVFFYIFFACSFPYFLFSMLLEQYVVSLFYLILAIYYYFENPKKTNYLYIGAVGTLVTSGIIFPLITTFKNLKQWLISAFKCFFAFIGAIIISGQLPQLFSLSDRFNLLVGNFATGITFNDKLFQYTAFIKGLFLPNHGHIVWMNNIPTYQLMTYNSIEWIGLIILILCFISFIINYKNKMAWISMIWIIFSSMILLFIGWGTIENGLILYSLYFSWAFLIMLYLLIDKICKSRWLFTIVIMGFSTLMMYKNIIEIINIFKFAVRYY